ncbi:MAG: type II secretion system protein [Pelagimonas sp.]|uniref:type II secretion system protein n=1 Tax=Pelagimonas sp. TaxID=2073170 RepID=UPI003D6B01E8
MDAEITSAIAPGDQADRGFTLIELLISIAILSVLAVGASLAIPRQGSPFTSDLAKFRTIYHSQRDLAIAGQQTLGLSVTRQNAQVMALGSQGWQTDHTPRKWSGTVTLSSKPFRGLPGPVSTQSPDIVFLPTGQTSAFRITFGTSVQCESDGFAGLTCTTS